MAETLLLDVVLPVYNEEAHLADSVRRLHRFLTDAYPGRFRITIADNASTDRTPVVAAALTGTLAEVVVLRLEQQGRGRALKAAWSRSPATVVAYMDVDLSTDVDHLPELVDPLLEGRADVTIGSRLAPGAAVQRGVRREVISRGYNLILRTSLAVGFRDAQCGFKALRSQVAAQLLPRVEDGSWFFDTELLVLAERAGYRVLEVPVRWRDDPDSSVAIVRTAVDDLQGIARLRRTRPGQPRAQREPVSSSGPSRGPWAQVGRFAVVGVVSTAVHLGLFALLAAVGWASQVANLVGLLLATVFNTAANRWFTFGVRGRARVVAHHLQALLVFAVTWGLSGLALASVGLIAPDAGTGVQTVAIAVGNAASTVLRFVALRSWVFRGAGSTRTPGTPSPPPDSTSDVQEGTLTGMQQADRSSPRSGPR